MYQFRLIIGSNINLGRNRLQDRLLSTNVLQEVKINYIDS
jgi:hypothetical protein